MYITVLTTGEVTAPRCAHVMLWCWVDLVDQNKTRNSGNATINYRASARVTTASALSIKVVGKHRHNHVYVSTEIGTGTVLEYSRWHWFTCIFITTTKNKGTPGSSFVILELVEAECFQNVLVPGQRRYEGLKRTLYHGTVVFQLFAVKHAWSTRTWTKCTRHYLRNHTNQCDSQWAACIDKVFFGFLTSQCNVSVTSSIVERRLLLAMEAVRKQAMLEFIMIRGKPLATSDARSGYTCCHTCNSGAPTRTCTWHHNCFNALRTSHDTYIHVHIYISKSLQIPTETQQDQERKESNDHHYDVTRTLRCHDNKHQCMN